MKTQEKHCDFEWNSYEGIMVRQIPPPQDFPFRGRLYKTLNHFLITVL